MSAARRAAFAALLLALLPAAGARAHRPAPEEVVARLREPALRYVFDVREVAPDPRLPRLLVVRVGPGWATAAPALRREAAEAWRGLWRAARPSGVLAVTDADGRSLVSFDALGRARLRSPGAPAP
jgi:hypothetical protein